MTAAMALCGVLFRTLSALCFPSTFISRGLRPRTSAVWLGGSHAQAPRWMLPGCVGARYAPPGTRAYLRAPGLLIGVGIALVAGCGGPKGGHVSPTATVSPLGGNLVTLRFKSPSGAEAELHVRVEANDADREHGLMGVTNLPEDEGDLFAWPDVAPNSDVLAPFWMKDTPIPLSIAFISADGRIQEIQDMQPETQTLHQPARPYRYAVEANEGWYERHDLPPGSTVNLPGALAPLHLPTGTPLAIPQPPPPPTFPAPAATP
jgi:uncharacterized membrane protein (UPF0127 family)